MLKGHKSTGGVLNSFWGFMKKSQPQAQKINKTVTNPTRVSATQFQTPDRFKFLYSYASYVHHGPVRKPVVNSLMDLTDSNSNISLLPKRRLYGNPFDTLSIKNGDDAMIVSPNLLGVADGVSGWSGEHADSGLFARSFLENISKTFTELSHQNADDLSRITEADLRDRLDLSYKESLAVMERDKYKGSSTLMVAMIIDSELKILNIGDSRIFIIRDGQIAWTNREQYIADLCPEQVGTTDKVKLPSQVVEFSDFHLEEDDLLMLCSDGITDNLYEDELLEFINSHLNKDHTNLGEVCHKLMIKAKSVAFDNYCVSPYVEKINEIGNNFITGGKLDDISVCLARVVMNY
ncbi:PP2C family protein-serine/threonine phosphatase [Cyberlindnera jadinii NRRL Y-1542]|uniref:Protein phosphatase n=1 Tax=Cyberlindnera jadinii (strain ATCC 18201 / CBS 1600 / BCRC 20928 / JCM 3617 / NBRC 0987 / NRRL Y-1542) TaxID=983966 RepID=A0A1E4RZ96_CYBJN|nr:protein serine/threonine phosphatase 2C [Cyberlindnera jadinii NRRL Y-1542]ODV72582.1 protein serine/threonine phosphatase 2C [Cyberlindnera jadinii NRRL Y-1542]